MSWYFIYSYLSHVTIVVASCLFSLSSAFSFLRIRITSLNMVVKDTQDTNGPISLCKSVLMHNGFPRSLKKDMELNCKCHRLNQISYKCKHVFHYYISDSSRMINLLFKISVCVCLWITVDFWRLPGLVPEVLLTGFQKWFAIVCSLELRESDWLKANYGPKVGLERIVSQLSALSSNTKLDFVFTKDWC